MTNNTQTRGRSRTSGALLVLSLGLLAFSGPVACKLTALRPDDDRSQFTRYDRTRNADAAPFIEDEFGRRTPNLRARLLVRD